LFSRIDYRLISIQKQASAWQNIDLSSLVTYSCPLLYGADIKQDTVVIGEPNMVAALSKTLLSYFNINISHFSGFMLFFNGEIVLIDFPCNDQSCISELENLIGDTFNQPPLGSYSEDYSISELPSSDLPGVGRHTEESLKKQGKSENIADELFPIEAHKLAYEVMERVNQLKRNGFEKLLIESLSQALFSKLKSLDISGMGLSTIKITNDYRIILTEYGEHEVELTPLPKVIFLFFLRHPEGVLFKRLYEHKDELIDLYKEVSLREDIQAMHRSIDELVDPTKNSINEKCSRIKEAFVKIMDDEFAKHYYITGHRGSEKRILLDRSLINWEYEPSVPKVNSKSEEDISVIQNQEIELIDEAKSFRLNGNRSKGLDLLTGVINANPYNTKALHLRAIIYYELQQRNFAINDYSRVIELNDMHSSAFYNRSIAHYVNYDYGKAINDLTSCIALLQESDKLLQKAHKLRADIYSKQKNRSAADADYRIAASLGCEESKQILRNS
jgi:tetratricopeptide (TPR) repeat protein